MSFTLDILDLKNYSVILCIFQTVSTAIKESCHSDVTYVHKGIANIERATTQRNAQCGFVCYKIEVFHCG